MQLKAMSGERAKVILQGILDSLVDMDKDDFTSLELSIFRKCTENGDILPCRGCEDLILKAERSQ